MSGEQLVQVVNNDLEGMFATPMLHPITCSNPAPWKIEECKIETRNNGEVYVWIRNKDSMWFRADQCIINSNGDNNG